MFQLKYNKSRKTRTISPKMGILGFLGFLGFLGLYNPKGIFIVPTFYLFFSFFGFFGLYYEGKMSGTLVDERYEENYYKAAYLANKIALLFIIVGAILCTSIIKIAPYKILSILISIIGLGFGLSVFLNHYLLYRFECKE